MDNHETARNVIDYHLTNIMNKDLYNNEFSENAKTAVVWPSNKKSDRPESVLHGFAKIFAK